MLHRLINLRVLERNRRIISGCKVLIGHVSEAKRTNIGLVQEPDSLGASLAAAQRDDVSADAVVKRGAPVLVSRREDGGDQLAPHERERGIHGHRKTSTFAGSHMRCTTRSSVSFPPSLSVVKLLC